MCRSTLCVAFSTSFHALAFFCPRRAVCCSITLCALLWSLGQCHCDCRPFVPEHRTEASLTPAAGTACAAIVACSHRNDCPLGPRELGRHTLKWAALDKNGAWWWWWWWW